MLKIVKRAEITPMQSMMQRCVAVIAALAAAAVFMLIMGYNPLTVFWNLIEGSLLSEYRFQQTINKTIPLVVISLGIAIAFKMKFWNIGVGGQFFMGAFAASYFALNFTFLPKPLLILVMFLAAMIAGAFWCFIPGFLKAKWGTNETLVTLMLNYVATKWIMFLQYGPWKDPNASGFPRIPVFDDAAVLPEVFGIHIGWIIAIILVVAVYFLLNKTKLGFEITVVGENIATARYAGMNVKKVLLISVCLSGAICGLAGMMQATGIEHSLTYQLSGGIGFTAIITCWLARLKPVNIVFVSFFFAMLIQGGAYLQGSLQIPSAVSGILQGIILFFVLASEFFSQYRFVQIKKHTPSKEVA